MEFPRYVFLSPGKTECQGGSYNNELVKDKVEFDAAIEAGFSSTLPEALASAKTTRSALSVKPVAAPTPVKIMPKLINRAPKVV